MQEAMGSVARGTPGEGRPRVVWSKRGRRRWCPGAGRSLVGAKLDVQAGWTSYLHWQVVLGALRGRREGANPGEPSPALPREREDASQTMPPAPPPT